MTRRLTLTAALALFALSNATARAESATAPDKVEHFAASAAVAGIATVLLRDTKHPVLYGFSVAFALGVAKEVYDSRSGGTGFSGSDLAADALGAAAGAGLTGWIVLPNFVGYRARW